jgi:hypothetical protein
VVIVDTTVWIEFFQGVENPETRWLNTNSIANAWS